MVQNLLFAAVLLYAAVTDVRFRIVPTHVCVLLATVGCLHFSLASITGLVCLFIPLFLVYTGTQDWQRLSFTGTVPTGTTQIRIYLGLINATGSAWFDCVQLEKGSAMSDCNLLDDSDFNRTDRWTACNFSSSDGDTYTGSGSITIHGEADGTNWNKYIRQSISVNKSNVCFIMYGTLQGNSVPLTGSRQMSLNMAVYYADGSIDYYNQKFNYCTTDEQSISFVVKPQSKTISSVNFYFLYRSNANTCVIKNAMLTFDQSGTTYVYDPKGNLTSAGDNAQNNQTYDYTDANELAKATAANSESYSYTYDSTYKHRVTAARSNQIGNGVTYSYDSSKNSYGKVTGTNVGTVSSSGVLSTSSPYISSSTKYTTDGDYVNTQTDARGYTTTYNNNLVNGNLNSVVSPVTVLNADDTNNNTFSDSTATTSYTYDPNTYQPLTITLAGSNGIQLSSIGYVYNSKNLLDTITHNSFIYKFNYDIWNNVTSILAGNHTLVTNNYSSNRHKALGLIDSVVYGNNYTVSYAYDGYDRVTTKTLGGQTVNYTYNSNNELAREIDNVGGYTTEYTYDLLGRMAASQQSNGRTNRFSYAYDNMNRLTDQKSFVNNYTQESIYTYGKDSLLSASYQGSMIYHYAYDNLNRLSTQTVNYGGPSATTTYAYLAGANGSTTGLVSSMNYTAGSGSYETIGYAYDAAGNIKTTTTTKGTSSTQTRYFYDQLGQLIRVDDQADKTASDAGTTTVNTYDVGGNITTVTKYAYTLGTPVTPVSQKTYGYTDSSWKDLLTSYNGVSLTYDAIGNPLNYRDGITMTWSGRQLATFSKSGTAISYGYNADGQRISKTVGSNVTKYYYDDAGRLIKAEEPSYNLWLYYNPSSTSPDSISYYGTRYSFLKNAQGDVIAILDSNSNVVAQYTYDAWGNVLSITDANGSTITDPTNVGIGNPIRYRGYYYDTETGLFYVGSRYYDPVTCRMLNADDTNVLTATMDDVTDKNLFAYCDNNPVVRADNGGDFWFLAALLPYGEVLAAAFVATPVGWIAAGAILSGVAVYAAIYLAKKTKVKSDPYARPGQKKQNREKKEKKKGDGRDWRGNPNKRPQPPKKHTPNRDHRKY